MIYVVAQLRLKPGTTERACAEARKVVAGTVKEDGCLFYDFNLSVTDPTRLVAVERWESKEALARHNETAASDSLARRGGRSRRRARHPDHHAGERRAQMKRVSEIKPAGAWNAASAADFVVLDAQDRHRRRVVFVGEQGATYLLDLPRPAQLRDGDGLLLEDGTLVRVSGKPEPLVEIAASSARELARLAWHIGNRHTEVQIVGDSLAHPPRPCAGGDAARPRRDAHLMSMRCSIPSTAPTRITGTGMGTEQAARLHRSARPRESGEPSAAREDESGFPLARE